MSPQQGLSQGVGVINFKKIVLRGLKQSEIEAYTKKKFVYPSHLQLSFYADHLETFTSSSELSLRNKAVFYTDLEWEAADLPRCYTAVNHQTLMQEQRLVVLLWLTNEYTNQEVIGQVNIKMDEIVQGVIRD